MPKIEGFFCSIGLYYFEKCFVFFSIEAKFSSFSLLKRLSGKEKKSNSSHNMNYCVYRGQKQNIPFWVHNSPGSIISVAFHFVSDISLTRDWFPRRIQFEIGQSKYVARALREFSLSKPVSRSLSSPSFTV